MNKICTSIEQSKKLVKLGLNRKTSDMYYWCGSDLRIGGYRAQDDEGDVPAWSLDALLRLLPKKLHGQTLCLETSSELWYIGYPWENVEKGEELMDCVFSLVCWLLRKNLI